MSEIILIKDTTSGDVYVTDGHHQCGPLHHTDWSSDGGQTVTPDLDLGDFNLDDEHQALPMDRVRILKTQE